MTSPIKPLDPRLVAPDNPRRDRRILTLIALVGIALTVIGVRFVFVPDAAARFFGVGSRPAGFQLHAVIGLRDIWLGVLALGLVWLAEWRALALWLVLGAAVCFGDAGIVAGSGGRPASLLFHMVSGVFCGVLAALAWRRANRTANVSTRADDKR